MAKCSKWLFRILTCVGLTIAFNWFGMVSVITIPLAIVVAFAVTTEDLTETLYVFYKTFPRNYQGVKLLLKFRIEAYRFVRNNGNIVERFVSQVDQHPYRACFIGADDRKWTYKEVDEMSNRVANAFHQDGYVKGDVVALFMESTPEFVITWLGLAKLGVITALVNYNLRMKSLAHSITAANSKALIFSTILTDAVVEVKPLLPSGIKFYYYGEGIDDRLPIAKSFLAAVQKSKTSKPPKIDTKLDDHLIYIYTSGTTGFPKPCVLSNRRFFLISSASHHMMGFQKDDVMYIPLPVYHTMAGVLGVGQSLCYGITLVIKKKFSASQFWDDCIKHKCTVTQYLGELCRYLVAQPPKPQDRAHSIRLVVGSGLRPKLWKSFVDRFGIKKISEFYGATEGVGGLINIDSTPGAVGFFPMMLTSLLPVYLIRVDEKTLTPLRDENGVCIRCKPGEPGIYVAKIISKSLDQMFDGYVNKEATSKKIIHNVFSKGDQAYISGDLMVMDRWGYVYFKDRTGDTFRWKGENVSTNEVEAVISSNINLNDAVVYGVEVPNCEGRAGMAAIVDPNHCVDLDQLYKCLAQELPPYARPLFIRTTDSLPMTGTLKLKKLELQDDGFNPLKCGQHKLYYLNGNKYSILTQQVYDDICNHKIRY